MPEFQRMMITLSFKERPTMLEFVSIPAQLSKERLITGIIFDNIKVSKKSEVENKRNRFLFIYFPQADSQFLTAEEFQRTPAQK